ncbi:MAG: hypothetical protein K8R23_14850 [Chthoniobacter sp.]|nr:hypothetical protein [Chthoniobacter sp.]
MPPNHDHDAPPSDPDERHPLTLLSHYYLAIGLPLPAAAAAACADLNDLFDDPTSALCAA